jgi:hypothetical protein
LSTSSPVSDPNSAASSRSRGARDSRWTAITEDRIATGYVWFFSEMQARKRAGWMLVWVVKPTRQPDRSPSAQAVTTNIG